MPGQILAMGGGFMVDRHSPLDDFIALHIVDTELREVVVSLSGARAYRAEPDSQTPIELRML